MPFSYTSSFLIIVRWIFIMIALLGFVWQSWNVTIEFFEYQTTTHVSIRDYHEKVIPPIVVLCAQLHNKILRKSSNFREIFTGETDPLNDRNDTWKVREITVTVFRGKGIKINSRAKKYLKTAKYCFYVKIDNVFPREMVVSPKNVIQSIGVTYYFIADFGTQPFLSETTWKVKDSEKCRPRMAYFFVLPNEVSIFKAGLPVIMQLMCTKNMSNYQIHLTYSESTTKRLPPPYETNCYNYNNERRMTTAGMTIDSPKLIMSSAHCYEKCLAQHAANWNLVPDTTVILRDKFLNSSMDIANIRVIEDDDYLLNRTKNPKRPPLISKYVSIAKKWPQIQKNCRDECKRIDCYSSRMIPSLSYLDEGKAGNNTNLESIKVLLKLSDDPILEIESFPKHKFMDFFVYLCGGASFWLGFCPVDISGWIEALVQKVRVRKNRKILEKMRQRRERDKRNGHFRRNGHSRNDDLQPTEPWKSPTHVSPQSPLPGSIVPYRNQQVALSNQVINSPPNLVVRRPNPSPVPFEGGRQPLLNCTIAYTTDYLRQRWYQRHPGVRHPYLD